MAQKLTQEEIETAEGFDRSTVEDIIQAYLERTIGGPLEMFESSNPGVIAFERPTGIDASKMDWDELAADIVRGTGIGVDLIANADWTFDDRPDEEAVYISCRIPSLPFDYSFEDNKYRAIIGPMLPGEAPSAEDFAKAREAKVVARAFLKELQARTEYETGEALATTKERLEAMKSMIGMGDVSALCMPLVEALHDRDFDRAIEVAKTLTVPVEEASSPKP